MHEVRETVYIAISSIILAIVLSVFSVFLAVRDNMADIRNSETASIRSMTQYRQFNKYDDKTVYGDEVIELIRLYYDSNLDIYIDKPGGNGPALRFNQDTIAADPSIVTLYYLQTKLNTKQEYIAQVAYNATDPSKVTSKMKDLPEGSEATGISFIWVQNH